MNQWQPLSPRPASGAHRQSRFAWSLKTLLISCISLSVLAVFGGLAWTGSEWAVGACWGLAVVAGALSMILICTGLFLMLARIMSLIRAPSASGRSPAANPDAVVNRA